MIDYNKFIFRKRYNTRTIRIASEVAQTPTTPPLSVAIVSNTTCRRIYNRRYSRGDFIVVEAIPRHRKLVVSNYCLRHTHLQLDETLEQFKDKGITSFKTVGNRLRSKEQGRL